MNFYELFAKGKENCIRNSPPPCSHACPLGIDVRDFMNKFQSGLAASAYKTFSIAAVFPGIVCHICPQPCKQACTRKDFDGAVNLKALEKHCWLQMHEKPQKSYFMREKKQKILVYGGEIGILALAVKLARRGYPVDIIVSENRLGGTLWDIEQDLLPEEVLQEEMQVVANEKFIHVTYGVSKIDEGLLEQYDAIVLPMDYLKQVCSQNHENIFTFADAEDPLKSIYQGNMLSYNVEEFIKIHKVFHTKDIGKKEPYVPILQTLEKKPPVVPADSKNWTEDEVKQEAGRCLKCQCNQCMDACPMMKYYHNDYPTLATAIMDTVEAQEIDKKRGLYPLMSCLQCGACEQACPVGINTKELILSSRRMIHKKKTLPIAHYNYWLQDMEHANKEAEFFIAAGGNNDYVYFPGCQMGASHPGYVECSYDWLRKLYPNRISLWSRCCCAPAYWSGNEALYEQETKEIRQKWNAWGKPTFILSCPTCMEQFQEAFPEIQVVSLWSLLAEHMEKKPSSKSKVAIFDSCAARENKRLQQDIRKIVFQAGYEGCELEKNREHAQCCGYGGLVFSTNAQLVRETIEQNAQQDDVEFVTYCTNCMDSFRLEQKRARFILDLVFGTEPQKDSPSLTQRRQNRKDLRKNLLKKYLNEERMEESMPYENICLKMNAATRQKLNSQLLLEEDIQDLIGHAEENSLFLYDVDTEEHIAHKQSGYITMWARYQVIDEQTYELHSVYFHRVKLKGERNGEK